MSEEEQKNTQQAPEGSDPSATATPADAGAQAAEFESRWKRALADYQNLQKEVARDRAEMAGYATLRVVESFLPLLDYLKQAQATKPASDDKAVANWVMGVDHVARMFEAALSDLGLRPIKTVGEKFDATKHEAVGEEESDQEPGAILKEVQSGYEMNGKPVRPSKVIVAK